ncbi:MAG TPA: hypothetical protein DD640_07665 [Clostridiales bacterium]|nr:hypothetical protein [Clostridiales bacterium]
MAHPIHSLNQRFQLPDLRRITLFLGAYGSGKSEISVNFACWLASAGKATTLADLDIINPYFRSADARTTLETAGVRLISPMYAGTNVDVPAVPGAIFSVFDDPSRMAVLDIGGEDLGARVIASLRPRLQAVNPAAALYMVVNPYRPFTETADRIVETARALAGAAGLPLSGLVHNANLLEQGDAALLTTSWPIIQEAARRLDLPVVFAAALHEAIPAGWNSKTPQGLPLLHLQRSIWYPDQL